jgi:hypothetical protein
MFIKTDTLKERICSGIHTIDPCVVYMSKCHLHRCVFYFNQSPMGTHVCSCILTTDACFCVSVVSLITDVVLQTGASMCVIHLNIHMLSVFLT